MGVAFNEKDYGKFLEIAKAYNKANGSNSFSLSMLASAYACNYAVTGDENFKKQSLGNMEQAVAMAGEDPGLIEYSQRIRHRLSSREIIKKKEFDKRFPDGWTEPGKE